MKRIFLVFAALLLAPAALAQGYRVQPGDVLSISVLEDANLNRELLVRPDGGISMPIAGNIRAAGNTVQAIERIIIERLAPGFSITPSVSVALAALWTSRSSSWGIVVAGNRRCWRSNAFRCRQTHSAASD